MTTIASIATLAALVGEPTRAAMLLALMDGRALSAGELARAAGITPPTASGHLARLGDAGLIAATAQGRHRYYRLAGADIASMIESLLAVSNELRAADAARKPVSTGPADARLRHARRCYDHLAGEAAVALAEALQTRGWLAMNEDGGVLDARGVAALDEAGLALNQAAPVLCRPCLDWSERRAHLGGALGRKLYAAMTERGWLRPDRAGRAVTITPKGPAGLAAMLGLAL